MKTLGFDSYMAIGNGLEKLIDEKFGQMLHAEKLGFVHPTTKEYMEFTASVPEKFNNILEKYKED